MSIKTKSVLLILIMLLIDQITKVYIKLNFQLGESVEVFSWFKILFVENNGMAFGWEFVGKLFLTLFRVVAVIVLGLFIQRLIKRDAREGFILTISLLLAGAAGNIVDSIFYGVIFSESTTYSVATMFGNGYASLMHGRVVDMFYFPLISDSSGNVIFFKYIFNIADSCVTVSAFILFIFFRKELNESLEKKNINIDETVNND